MRVRRQSARANRSGIQGPGVGSSSSAGPGDYHQRPETPLQSPCRASSTRPGAQRETETEVVSSPAAPSRDVAQPRASASPTNAIAIRTAVATG